MRICKEQIEDHRKVANRPSKPGNTKLLEWGHREELRHLWKADFSVWGHCWSAGSAGGEESWAWSEGK